MAARKGIGNARRFRIFERDGFRCQYCGRTPPATILQVDHVLPVTKGGKNDEANLVTSCLECNAGKRDRIIEPRAIPRDYKAMADDAGDRTEQLRLYRSHIASLRAEMDAAIDDVGRCFWGENVTWKSTDEWGMHCRNNVEKFIKLLDLETVMDAARIAFAKFNYPGKRFKYFCGICWNRCTERGIRKDSQNAS